MYGFLHENPLSIVKSFQVFFGLFINTSSLKIPSLYELKSSSTEGLGYKLEL